jgi:biopolymer transport protein ExbD
MPIRRPEPTLFRSIPLRFVRARLAGGGRRAVDASIPLVPFIDFLITLVVFLLASFGSGEIAIARPNLVVPAATHARDLELAPIVTIDDRVVTLDGRRMIDVGSVSAAGSIERIEPLIADLEVLAASWDVLHPGAPFPGTIIVQADRHTDFRVIKNVMFSAAQAGYANVSFAVNDTGG